MPQPSAPLTPRRAVGLTALFLLIQFACAIVAGGAEAIVHYIRFGKPGPSEFATHPGVLSVINILALYFVTRAELRRSKATWQSFVSTQFIPATLLPAVLLLLVGTVILVYAASHGLRHFFPIPEFLRMAFSKLSNLGKYPVGAPFALVVMAPVVEEILLRALLLGGLLCTMRPWRAIALTTALFAGLHLNPWQLPVSIGLGVVLGWLFFRTRSLGLCIAGHAFVNGTAVIAPGLPFSVRGFNAPAAVGETPIQPWWFTLLGVCLAVGGAILFNRQAPVTPVVDILPVPTEPPRLANSQT